jgi:hypothetical protein
MNLSFGVWEAMRSLATDDAMEAHQSCARATAAPESGERALQDASSRDDDEVGDPSGALDSFNDRTVGILHGALQLLTVIAAVEERLHKRRMTFACRGDEGEPSRS